MTTGLQKILIRLKADIFIETMEAWKQWNDIISAEKKSTKIPSSPALWRYNWHITVYKYKGYKVMVWYTYIL